MTDLITVTIACPSEDVAERLGRMLVEARLAACVQSHPVRSTYRWQGQIETADEYVLTVKTIRDRLAALEAFVTANHPYEVPELIAQPVEWASDAYARWVCDSVKPT